MALAGADSGEFVRGLIRANEVAKKAALGAVDEFGEHVVGDGAELAPVASGALKASGTTTPAEDHGGKIVKEIGFNTDYAAAVHEIPPERAHHEQGQWKYLETAMRNNQPKMMPFVGGKVRTALAAGGGA